MARKSTAGDFAAGYLRQTADLVSPADGELLRFNGKCYEDEKKKNILTFISSVSGDEFATARMVNEVYDTICISRAVSGRWRPFLRSNPGIEPVSVLTLQDCNLWIKDNGAPQFKPHSADVVTTVATEYASDKSGATCPEFDKFLDWFTVGRDTLRTYVLQVMGLLLCRFLDPQIIPIFVGTGANGKGVLFNAIRQMLGEGNCSGVPMDRLGQRFSLHQLKHKIANLDADLCETTKAKEAALKKLCDRSLSEFERKYRDPTSMACFARFLFASNAYIPFRDKSNGLGRRIRYIPCENTVSAASKVEKLESLFWLPGVLNRVLAEIPDLAKYGLIDCPYVQAKTAEGRLDGNPAHQFLADYVAVRSDERLVKSYLYGMYVKWCEDNGYKALSAGNFGKEVASYFYSEIGAGDVVLDGKTSGGSGPVQSLAETDEQFAKRKANFKPSPRRNCYIGLTYCVTGVDNLEPLPEPIVTENQESIPF